MSTHDDTDDNDHSIDTWKLGLERDRAHPIARLVSRGLTCAEAVDFYMVQIEGMNTTIWAHERDVTRQAISNNIRSAEMALELGEDQ